MNRQPPDSYGQPLSPVWAVSRPADSLFPSATPHRGQRTRASADCLTNLLPGALRAPGCVQPRSHEAPCYPKNSSATLADTGQQQDPH